MDEEKTSPEQGRLPGRPPHLPLKSVNPIPGLVKAAPSTCCEKEGKNRTKGGEVREKRSERGERDEARSNGNGRKVEERGEMQGNEEVQGIQMVGLTLRKCCTAQGSRSRVRKLSQEFYFSCMLQNFV
ncbi:unnamed protein product [Xylocopa violacea]|uniref:Uncharacterized protein n=1 Tax=Xylocopa violacea TaxID=135666 RepID=A0ABP1NLC2_XYLVO